MPLDKRYGELPPAVRQLPLCDILGLGLGEVSHPAEQVIGLCSSDDLEQLLGWAQGQRILLALSDTLEATDAASSPASEMCKVVTELRRDRQALFEAMSELSAAFRESSSCFAFLKGFQTESLYPSGVFRQHTDLDLALPSFDELWRITPALRKLGYTQTSLIVNRSPSGDVYHGGAVFLKPHNNPKCLVQLDITVGSQHIVFGSSFNYDDDFWRNLVPHADAADVKMFSPRHSLLVFLAELINREYLRVRETFDFLFHANALSVANVDWLVARLKTLDIESQLKRILVKLAADDMMERLDQQFSTRLHELGFLPLRNDAEADEPVVSFLLETKTKQFGQVEGIKAAKRALEHCKMLRSPPSSDGGPQSSVRQYAKSIDVRKTIDEGLPIQFALLSTDPFHAMQLLEVEDATIATTPVGLFLATPFGIVDVSHLKYDAEGPPETENC